MFVSSPALFSDVLDATSRPIGTALKWPLAIPGTAAYRRLRSLLDEVSDPGAEPCPGRGKTDGAFRGSVFRVRVKTRRFRATSRLFAFLQFGIGGRMIRFHPSDASAGEYEFRISRTSTLAYLTEPRTGRTWVFTLEPFRRARRDGREASAIALGAPFANPDVARWCARRLVDIARWLKAQRRALPAPSRDGQPVPVMLSGRVVAGVHIIDPVTGRQLVTLRSQSLHAGEAYLTVEKEAIRLSQDDTTVYFPVKDILARWGNQITRSAIYTSAEEAKQRAAELRTHLDLGRLITQALVCSREPDAELRARFGNLGAVAAPVCSDQRGRISLALALSKRLGGTRRIAFRLEEFGPRARFTPDLCWVPHQGLMVTWTAADGSVVAFGVTRRGARRFGVFQSAAAAQGAAARTPAALIREAMSSRRDSGNDLRERIANFNRNAPFLRADNRQVAVANLFAGEVFMFPTASSRALWSPAILLSKAGPVWVMFAGSSIRQSVWRAYGPLRKEGIDSRLEAPSAEGMGRPALEALAALLTKRLSICVTTVSPADETALALETTHCMLRRAIPAHLKSWSFKDPATQVCLFYDVAESLRDALLSSDDARRREAVVAAEYFFFGKPEEQILNLHSPLFKSDARIWSAVLGEGGCVDARAKEIVRNLGAVVSERPKQGLPATIQSRFSKFQEAVIRLIPAQGVSSPT